MGAQEVCRVRRLLSSPAALRTHPCTCCCAPKRACSWQLPGCWCTWPQARREAMRQPSRLLDLLVATSLAALHLRVAAQRAYKISSSTCTLTGDAAACQV